MVIQETQLSITKRATRLQVSQVTKHGTIPYMSLILNTADKIQIQGKKERNTKYKTQ